MGSLIDELQRREAATREEAEELRGRIAQLSERLAGVEERLSRLVITRETVEEVLNGSGAEAAPAAAPDGVAPPRSGPLSAVGVLAVPPWEAGLEASVLPEAYRDLLEVAEDAGRPLRAAQIAAAAGLSTDKAKVEGLRSKLKRLVERGWLAGEAGPGLFGLAVRNGTGEVANRGDGGLFFLGSEGANRHEPQRKKSPMEPYAPTGGADPFAASMKLVTALVADLQAAEAAGLTAYELEQFVASRGREVQRQMVQDHLDLRAAREEETAREHRAPVVGADGIPRRRVEAGHRRLLATLFGTVQVRRCAWRRPGTGNLYPADAALSLPAPRHCHTLARLAVLEAARGSFEAAHAAITGRCGPVMGKRQAGQAVVNAAGDIAAFYAARIPMPCTAKTLLVISADAKGVVMRPGALRAATAKAAARRGRMRTRLAAGEKPNRKRMATLACVYDAEPAPRRPHDVIAPPGGRQGSRMLRPRPKAKAKWLAGSVRHDPAEVIAAAFDQAEARDPAHWRRWIVLVDGAEHQLGPIRAEAARRGVTISILIDLIHVLEYIWKAAWSLHAAGDPAAEDWVAVKALAVLTGNSAQVAAAITAEAEAAGLTASQRHGADACVHYLTSKHEFLRYDQALAAGLPIATGVIEGACRHLIGDRLGISGARWGLDGAEAILTLRAVISNGDFEEYWRFHLP
jgi:hypothetical protein